MRTKVTLVLLFLNVALFFFIFKFEREWKTEAASLEARRRVLGAEAADIRALTVTTANHAGEFTLERPREQWLLTKPLQWPANRAAADAIVNELQLLEHEASFPVNDLAKTGQSLADYGIDVQHPKMAVEFRSGSTTATPTRLIIGDSTSNRLYVLSPAGDRVHVVNRSLLEILSVPIEKLRADTVLNVPVFEARSLSIQTALSGEAARAAATGALRMRIRHDINSGRWAFEAPITARASKLAVETTINMLNALRVKSFPADAPAVVPTLRLTLEGNNRLETLFIGEPVPNARPAQLNNETAAEYFAQLENRPAIFTVLVPAKLVATLTNAQTALRDRRVLDFDPRTVTAITLAAPVGNQPPVVLQRLDPSPTVPEGSWQIVRRGEGAQAAQTQPADPELVQRLLVQLTLLSAKPDGGFVSDAPTSAYLENWGFNRPEREVTLAFANAGPGSTSPAAQKLQLGTDAQRNVYARVITGTDSGNSVYLVDEDFFRELPLNPIAWRLRLVQELPSTARLSALKITDLAGAEKVLLETPLSPAGEPTTKVPNAAVVQKITAQLRRLHAARFVQAGFTDRVAAADDEPWRYRIDATISLAEGPAEQNRPFTLFVTKRVGGAQQYAGSKEIDGIFELEQPFIDALWPLTEGANDPGPAAPAPNAEPKR